MKKCVISIINIVLIVGIIVPANCVVACREDTLMPEMGDIARAIQEDPPVAELLFNLFRWARQSESNIELIKLEKWFTDQGIHPKRLEGAEGILTVQYSNHTIVIYPERMYEFGTRLSNYKVFIIPRCIKVTNKNELEKIFRQIAGFDMDTGIAKELIKLDYITDPEELKESIRKIFRLLSGYPPRSHAGLVRAIYQILRISFEKSIKYPKWHDYLEGTPLGEITEELRQEMSQKESHWLATRQVIRKMVAVAEKIEGKLDDKEKEGLISNLASEFKEAYFVPLYEYEYVESGRNEKLVQLGKDYPRLKQKIGNLNNWLREQGEMLQVHLNMDHQGTYFDLANAIDQRILSGRNPHIVYDLHNDDGPLGSRIDEGNWISYARKDGLLPFAAVVKPPRAGTEAIRIPEITGKASVSVCFDYFSLYGYIGKKADGRRLIEKNLFQFHATADDVDIMVNQIIRGLIEGNIDVRLFSLAISPGYIWSEQAELIVDKLIEGIKSYVIRRKPPVQGKTMAERIAEKLINGEEIGNIVWGSLEESRAEDVLVLNPEIYFQVQGILRERVGFKHYELERKLLLAVLVQPYPDLDPKFRQEMEKFISTGIHAGKYLDLINADRFIVINGIYKNPQLSRIITKMAEQAEHIHEWISSRGQVEMNEPVHVYCSLKAASRIINEIGIGEDFDNPIKIAARMIYYFIDINKDINLFILLERLEEKLQEYEAAGISGLDGILIEIRKAIQHRENLEAFRKGILSDILVEFFRMIPKADIHHHLDGSISPDVAFRALQEYPALMAKYGNPKSPEDLKKHIEFNYKGEGEINWDDLWAKFDLIYDLLDTDPETGKFVARESALEDFRNDGLTLVEYKISVITPGLALDPAKLLEKIVEGLLEAEEETGGKLQTGLILCIWKDPFHILGKERYEEVSKRGTAEVLKEAKKEALRQVQIAVDLKKKWEKEKPEYAARLVGFDTVGDEKDYVRSVTQPALELAFANGFKITEHLGENWHPGCLKQALLRIKQGIKSGIVSRIGHATALGIDPGKLQGAYPEKEIREIRRLQCEIKGLIVLRGIHIETNPSSNLLLVPEKNLGLMKGYREHPVKGFYFELGNVSVNTDDSWILHTRGLSGEFMKIWLANPELTGVEIQQIIKNGFDHSFIAEREDKGSADAGGAIGTGSSLAEKDSVKVEKLNDEQKMAVRRAIDEIRDRISKAELTVAETYQAKEVLALLEAYFARENITVFDARVKDSEDYLLAFPRNRDHIIALSRDFLDPEYIIQFAYILPEILFHEGFASRFGESGYKEHKKIYLGIQRKIFGEFNKAAEDLRFYINLKLPGNYEIEYDQKTENDSNIDKDKLRTLLKDKDFLYRTLKRLYGEYEFLLPHIKIARIKVEHDGTGLQKQTLHVSFYDETTGFRIGFALKVAINRSAKDGFAKGQRDEIATLKELSGKCKIPKFGVYVAKPESNFYVYTEEWIGGPTAARVMARRKLTKEKLTNLVEAYLSVIKALGTRSDKGGYLGVYDVQTENVMFESWDSDIAVTVDIGKIDYIKSLFILQEFDRHYSKGDKELHTAIFNGVIKVFGQEEGLKFLEEALNSNTVDRREGSKGFTREMANSLMESLKGYLGVIHIRNISQQLSKELDRLAFKILEELANQEDPAHLLREAGSWLEELRRSVEDAYTNDMTLSNRIRWEAVELIMLSISTEEINLKNLLNMQPNLDLVEKLLELSFLLKFIVRGSIQYKQIADGARVIDILRNKPEVDKQFRFDHTYPPKITLDALELNSEDVYLNIGGGPGVNNIAACLRGVKKSVYLDISGLDIAFVARLKKYYEYIRDNPALREMIESRVVKVIDFIRQIMNMRGEPIEIRQDLTMMDMERNPNLFFGEESLPQDALNNQNPPLDVYIADAADMPLPNDYVTKVSILGLFRWISKQGGKGKVIHVIRETLRVTKEGGLILLRADNPFEEEFIYRFPEIAKAMGISVRLKEITALKERVFEVVSKNAITKLDAKDLELAKGKISEQIGQYSILSRRLKRKDKNNKYVFIDKKVLPVNQQYILEGDEWNRRKGLLEKMFPGYIFDVFSGSLRTDMNEDNAIVLLSNADTGTYDRLNVRKVFIQNADNEAFSPIDALIFLGVGLLDLSDDDKTGSDLRSTIVKLYEKIAEGNIDVNKFLKTNKLTIKLKPIAKFDTELEIYAISLLEQAA